MNARVASTSSNWDLKGLWEINGSLLRLRRHGLSGAVDNLSVLHDTLNKPMVLTLADYSLIDTSLAEIIITILASAAVIVNIWDRFVAVVAVDSEDANSLDCRALAAFVRERSKFSKPLVTSSGATGDWDLGA